EIFERHFQILKRRGLELALPLQLLHRAVAETRRNERDDLRARPERRFDAHARRVRPLFPSEKREPDEDEDPQRDPVLKKERGGGPQVGDGPPLVQPPWDLPVRGLEPQRALKMRASEEIANPQARVAAGGCMALHYRALE